MDGLRGLAAFYVMVGHARVLLWEGYSDGFLKHPDVYSILDKALMYFFGLFKYGVEVVFFFFVLSGFVIHLKYARQLRYDRHASFDYWQYLWRRIKRIYPPFIFALLLTFILDKTGAVHGFNQWERPVQGIPVTHFLDTKTFFLNLLFLYDVYTPLFGSNGPAWSLKYEWWFYLLYPVLIFFFRKNISLSTACILLLLGLTFLPVWTEGLSRQVFSLMICWWFGVLLAEIYVGRISISLKYSSFAILFFLIAPFLKSYNEVLYFVDISLGFFGLLSLCLYYNQKGSALYILSRFQNIDIIHYPMLYFLRGWYQSHHGGALSTHFGFVFFGVTLTLIVSYFVHFLVEVPFISSRRNIVMTDLKTID